jgi:hypothetical protein
LIGFPTAFSLFSVAISQAHSLHNRGFVSKIEQRRRHLCVGLTKENKMTIIITTAVLALFAGFVYARKRISRGKELVEAIRQEADSESWRAAQAVAFQTNPRAFEAAQAAFVQARDAMHRSFNSGSATTVQHCLVDVRMANEHVGHAVSQDEVARLAYDKVQNLYGSVIGRVFAHPTRALKIYPTLEGQVKAIIDRLVAQFNGLQLEEVDRFRALPQISQAELQEHQRALEGDDFFRRLKGR